jgi:hypothetical protein
VISASTTLDSLFRRSKPALLPFNNLTALKWLAVLSMLADHVRYIPGMDISPLLTFGRIAFPLFCFILSFHVARAFIGEDKDMLDRMLVRLIGFGLVAQIPFMLYFGKSLGTLNILFTFALSVGMFRLPLVISVFAFIALGGIVDYYWQGILFFLASVYMHVSLIRAKPLQLPMMAMLGTLVLICVTVSNYAALAAIPLMVWCVRGNLKVELPRWSKFFYWFYPSHLFVLLGLQVLLSK